MWKHNAFECLTVFSWNCALHGNVNKSVPGDSKKIKLQVNDIYLNLHIHSLVQLPSLGVQLDLWSTGNDWEICIYFINWVYVGQTH